MKTTSKPAVIGVFRTKCGRASCRCARRAPPLGCHRPRVEARQARDAMFFGRRTGCQWQARPETDIGSRRAAPRASKSGRRLASAWRGGSVAWWPLRPCQGLTGKGSRGTTPATGLSRSPRARRIAPPAATTASSRTPRSQPTWLPGA